MGASRRTWGGVLSEASTQPTQDPKSFRWKRLAFRFFGGLLAAVLGLGLLGVLWLGSASGEAWLGRKIQSALDDALVSGTAQVGRVHSNGFSKFSLEDLSIVENGVTLVALSELALSPRVWPLILGRLEFSETRVERLALDLRLEESGVLNLVRLFTAEEEDVEPSTGLPMPLSIDSLQVDALELTLDTGDQVHSLEKGHLSVVVDAEGLDWRFRDLKLRGQLNQKPLEVGLSYAQFGSETRIENVGLVWAENRLNGSLVERSSGMELTISDGDLALRPLLDLAGFSERVEALDEQVEIAGVLLLKEQGWSFDFELDALGGDTRCVLASANKVVSGAMGFEGVEASLLFPELGENVELDGVVLLEPSTLERQILRVILGPTRIQGHPVEGFAAEFAVEGAAVDVHSVRIRHPAGWGQLGGRVDGNGFVGDIQVRVSALAKLKELGVEGFRGQVDLRGALALNWAEALSLNLDGRMRGRNLSLPGAFALGQVQGPVDFQWKDGKITAAGGFKGEEGLGHQSAAQEVFGAWSAASTEAGAISWELDLELGQVQHQQMRLKGLSGAFQGVGSEIAGAADLSDLVISHLVWPSGRVVLNPSSDTVSFDLSLLDEEQEPWRVQGALDLEAEVLSVEALSVAPNGGVWALEQPVDFYFGTQGWALGETLFQSISGGAVSVFFDSDTARIQLQEFPLEVLDSFTGNRGHKGHLTGLLEQVNSQEGPRLSGHLAGVKWVVPGWIQGLKFDLSLQPKDQGERVVLNLARGAKKIGQVDLLIPVGSGGWDLDWGGALGGELLLYPTDNSLLKKVIPALSGLPRGFSAGALQLGGTLKSPRFQVEGGVEWMLAEGPEFLRADVFLEQIEGVLSGHGDLRQAGRPLAEWKGRIRTGLPETLAWLAGEGSAPPIDLWDHWWQDGQVRVLSKGMAIDAIRPLLPFSLPVEGDVSGSLLMEGKPSKPWVHAGFSLTNGRLGDVEVPMAMLSLNPDAKGYGVFAYGTLDEETLQVEGRIDLDLSSDRLLRDKLLDEALQLQVHGALPLSVAGAWSGAIQNANGAVGVQGEITGSLKEPAPNLRLWLKNGSLDWRPEGLGLSEISFEGILKPDGLRIPRFSLKTQPTHSASGLDFRAHESLLSGSVVLPFDETGRAELELIAVDAWLSDLPHQRLRVDGALSAEGPLNGLRVDGKFKINEGFLERTSADWLAEDALSLDPGIQLHRKRETVAVQEKAPSLWRGWRYALDIDLGTNTWIDAEVPLTESYGVIASRVSTIGLMGRLDGSVQLVDQDGELGLQGEVDIQRGRSKVFGTDFELESGRLLFSGASLAAPVLDLRAVHDSGKYGDIRVDIQGQPESLSLGFSSSEGFSDTDMAAILLFNRPASSMTQSEGGAGLDILGAAIGVMAGQASQFLRMSRLVDLVEVESSGESISAIRLGWSIGDDLFLTTSQDYSAEEDENTTAVTLEWLLSRRLQAEFSTGDAGESSADLFMRWRF